MQAVEVNLVPEANCQVFGARRCIEVGYHALEAEIGFAGMAGEYWDYMMVVVHSDEAFVMEVHFGRGEVHSVDEEKDHSEIAEARSGIAENLD